MSNPMTFVVRTAIDPDAAVASARQRVWAVDKDLALTSVTTLKAVVDESMGDHGSGRRCCRRSPAWRCFLAALGIYGVLAYFVSQRSRELGIRLALGAHPRAVFRLVVGQGCARRGGRRAGHRRRAGGDEPAQSLLFGVQPIDPITYASRSRCSARSPPSRARCPLCERRASIHCRAERRIATVD
jgi:hypothetical protein